MVTTNNSLTINPVDLSTRFNYLGKGQFAVDPLFAGRLDDVRFVDSALSDSAIAALAFSANSSASSRSSNSSAISSSLKSSSLSSSKSSSSISSRASSLSSSKASSSKSSSGSGALGCGVCNWYGTSYPSCCTTTSGWGWESNMSCIAPSTCASQ
ncbi:MAG: carbohydrate-binding domain-containing protein [Cellvibrio sp.]